mmetsp:Transcript_52080/g.122070  ORF Transcript_52080/g.122070 Transcript_52080/m.122070 type:complete len:133 (+) Transcript_52080:675-1073(+)
MQQQAVPETIEAKYFVQENGFRLDCVDARKPGFYVNNQRDLPVYEHRFGDSGVPAMVFPQALGDAILLFPAPPETEPGGVHVYIEKQFKAVADRERLNTLMHTLDEDAAPGAEVAQAGGEGGKSGSLYPSMD